MNRLDTITGSIFFVFSIFGLIFVVPQETFSLGEDFGLSPSFFPYVVFGLLLILSGLLAIKSIFISSDEPAYRMFAAGEFNKFLLNCGLACCSIVGLHLFGFLIMAPLIITATMLIMGCRKWWLLAVVALLPSVILYMVFVVILNLPLPKGVLLR